MNWLTFSRICWCMSFLVFVYTCFGLQDVVWSAVAMMYVLVCYIGMECAEICDERQKEEER